MAFASLGRPAIAWLRRDVADVFCELPLSPPLCILETTEGVLIYGVFRAERSVALPFGVRLFLRSRGVDHGFDEIHLDGASRIASDDSAPALEVGEALLRSAEGTLRIPGPENWPVFDGEVGALSKSPHRPPEAPSLIPTSENRVPLRLVPCRPRGPRDAVLQKRGQGGSVGTYLAAAQREERRDLFRGEAGPVWWITGPRGLAPSFPANGRAFTNLSSPLEPVLVPCDRRPRPSLSARGLRTAFHLADGEGLLWWDGTKGEHAVRFRRSDLVRLDSDEIVSLGIW